MQLLLARQPWQAPRTMQTIAAPQIIQQAPMYTQAPTMTMQAPMTYGAPIATGSIGGYGGFGTATLAAPTTTLVGGGLVGTNTVGNVL